MQHYAIVDIETTGGSPKKSKITEIAIYKHDGTKIIDEFISLVNPEMSIPPFIVQLTGISDNMVKNAPRFFEIAKQIVEFTENCVFVAHNVGFDYGILRSEFRSLGFDFRRPHLCTVRTSRYVIPGHDSYSLGKLSRSLGIEITERHRAGGDALATAHLFSLLMETDPNNLESFVQKELNPKRLHPNLDIDALEEIPNKIGIYKFYNDVNQLIYIGKSIHIRKRIDQHLRNSKTKKGIQMQKEIARIEFELTGSELFALLRESELIKQNKPIYNRSLTRSSFPYGLFHYKDEAGYIHFHIDKINNREDQAITSFTTRKEGVSYLERMVEDYDLCNKLCGLYKTNGACFQYTVKNCLGACVKEEANTSYNRRCETLIDNLTFNGSTFYVLDKGRSKDEKSVAYIENGSLRAIGYIPVFYRRKSPKNWVDNLDYIDENRDARTILNLFLRKNKSHEVINFID